MDVRVVFAGGGTGGHLFPALAIADALRTIDPEAAILFIGTQGKIEARVVPAQGYDFAPIWISGLRRTVSLSTLAFPLKVVVALVQSFFILRKFGADVVVGTGGYVCGPPVFMGSLMGLPTVVQEQNSFPGTTTRILARRATQVHLTFETTRRSLRREDNVMVSGNPVRAAVGTIRRAEAAAALGIDPERRTLLVVGGSQGAASMNAAIGDAVADVTAAGVQILWLTGEREYARLASALSPSVPGSMVTMMPFCETMEHAYAVADLAVCRSGATTLAELMCAGVPSILVPYPHAAADHQTANARAMVEKGAALLCPDEDAGTALKGMVLDTLSQPSALMAMATAARSMARPDAAMTIARSLYHLARTRHDG